MGRKNRLDSIEAKIEKAQQRVSITCERYEAATAQQAELRGHTEIYKEQIKNEPFPAIGIGLKDF